MEEDAIINLQDHKYQNGWLGAIFLIFKNAQIIHKKPFYPVLHV